MAVPKFKVGDKVRLLSSAIMWNVPKDEINKFGIIKFCNREDGEFRVYMDKPWEMYGCRETWVVMFSHIELVVKPGQQLMFAFMSE